MTLSIGRMILSLIRQSHGLSFDCQSAFSRRRAKGDAAFEASFFDIICVREGVRAGKYSENIVITAKTGKEARVSPQMFVVE